MNPAEMMVLAVAITALLMTVTVVVLFAVFHRRIDQFYNAIADRMHEVEKSIEAHGQKIAVIHHIATAAATATSPAAPAAAAPIAKN